MSPILFSLCKASFWFLCILLSPVKRVPLWRPNATKRRSPSRRQARQNDQRNPPERRRRKRRNPKVRSAKRRRAWAAATRPALQKTGRGGRRGKVHVRIINVQKSARKRRRAAPRTAATTKRGKGLRIIKNESWPPTETPTRNWARGRGGGTGKKQTRRARAVVLQTETAQVPTGESTNAAPVCLNFRRPPSAGLLHLRLASTQPRQPVCTSAHTPLHRLHAARTAWWENSGSSLARLEEIALVPSILLSAGLAKRLFKHPLLGILYL